MKDDSKDSQAISAADKFDGNPEDCVENEAVSADVALSHSGKTGQTEDLEEETNSDDWEETEDVGDEVQVLDQDYVDEGDLGEEGRVDSEDDRDDELPEPAPSIGRNRPGEIAYPPAPCWLSVRQGECILSLAKQYHLSPKTILSAPENQDLQKKGREPNILFPGDRVFIPQLPTKEEACSTEQRHRFQSGFRVCELKLRLLRGGKPRVQLSYRLYIQGREFDGSTDGDGFIRERIPADAREGKLVLLEPDGEETYPLALGCVDPLDEVSGVQTRLNNLGFWCGVVDGKVGPFTKRAIAAFQMEYGLSVTGQIDPSTRQRIKDAHGS